ncbi:ornithine cyclodeaminase family protein [Verticiella sediminum]|uniref:Ornithine cyclodeaminase family protein n=1 Tax=Verticiella sediminum TaxID=1247510 RepID=A0A556AC88_9BURK|nr:ornithine cyclodeaminase family protein [Verticiella sediminum]TSH90504.1 ornithine cyclodeaminase family protein [Verticiella sediminum]
MLHITDDMIDRLVTPERAQQLLRDAFVEFGHGRAAMQARERTQAAGVKLSTLGAVIPGQGVAGAKVYTTIEGRFSFVIVLFSTADGRPLASLDAGAITRLRTAACSVIAARELARPGAATLAVYGFGVQGQSHAREFARAYPLERILVHSPGLDPDLLARMADECGAAVQAADAETAAREADIIVTASRSSTPLFDGGAVRPGTFIAAIGSSLPHTRELDDTALRRAAAIVVEWKPQSLREAGDLLLAGDGAVRAERIVELAELLCGEARPICGEDEILLYKSVGVGLEDIAIAGEAYRLAGPGARRGVDAATSGADVTRADPAGGAATNACARPALSAKLQRCASARIPGSQP